MDGLGSLSLRPFKITKGLKKVWAKKIFRRNLGLLLFFSGVSLFLLIPLYKGVVAPDQVTPSTPTESTPTPPAISMTDSEGNKVFDHGPIKIGENLLHQGSVRGEDLPQRIIVPSLLLDLAVRPARVVGGTWEIFEDTAAFGLGSSPPGEKGNTVIFAHAKKGFFGPLRNIKKETKIYILTQKGWYLYQVNEIKTVTPKQVEVLLPTDEETLTLYTCSGFADTKRLIVRAKRVTPESF